jgi:hypothetical protein
VGIEKAKLTETKTEALHYAERARCLYVFSKKLAIEACLIVLHDSAIFSRKDRKQHGTRECPYDNEEVPLLETIRCSGTKQG